MSGAPSYLGSQDPTREYAVLLAHRRGNYRFLKGIEPYSCGVTADPGYEIVHVTLRQPQPWREGFEWIDAHLQANGRDRRALCGVELRSPAPFTMAGFVEFNGGYCEVLRSWGVYVDDLNPVARTNVAPADDAPSCPVLHGFSYTAVGDDGGPVTFVVAGAGELRDGLLDEAGIVRRGETGPEAMREKAEYVAGVMDERVRGLGGDWHLVNVINVYTTFLYGGLLEDAVLPRVGGATRHGLCWLRARPPVLGIDFEMDLRGVRSELVL